VRALLVLLLLFPMLADAAVRRLTECGTLPETISEAAPFDLDSCSLVDGDDIAELIDDVVDEWGAVHLRAPSATRAVIYTGTQTFTGMPFTFVEDQSGINRLTIQHVPATYTAQMWLLTNATKIVIGGPNLGLTFLGTHPGLGQGAPCAVSTRDNPCTVNSQVGLIEVTLGNGSNPALFDFRANAHKTWGHALYVAGGAGDPTDNFITSRWQQMNVAGLFMSSGVYVNSGVMDVWVDPDRTVVMDPWNRGAGWDGSFAATNGEGVKVGCRKASTADGRTHPRMEFQYTHRVTGGVTFEYGMPNANLFVPKYVGASGNPYLIRIKDFGFSGPEEITGLPSGIMVKGWFTGIMKNDPSDTHGLTEPFRFVRFQQLPYKYGNGIQAGPIASGCAVGTESNNYHSSRPYVWMPEASRDNPASSPYVNAFWDVTMAGFTPWFDMPDGISYFRSACESPDGSEAPLDRCHHNTLRVAGGTSMPGIAPMLDHTTVTGPGSWHTVDIQPIVTSPGGVTINPINNTVTDTRIRSAVTIGINADNTILSNVDFSVNASARTIMTVDAGSDVTVSDICVPSGSQITGSGSVTLDGVALTLPYTFAGALTDCSITQNDPPGPPGVP
jgi:hypothetical protein